MLEGLDDSPTRDLRLGLPDRFIEHGKRELLLDEVGLTPGGVAARTVRALREPAGLLRRAETQQGVAAPQRHSP